MKRVLAGEKGDVKGRASLASGSQEPDNKNVREEEPQSRKEKEVSSLGLKMKPSCRSDQALVVTAHVLF